MNVTIITVEHTAIGIFNAFNQLLEINRQVLFSKESVDSTIQEPNAIDNQLTNISTVANLITNIDTNATTNTTNATTNPDTNSITDSITNVTTNITKRTTKRKYNQDIVRFNYNRDCLETWLSKVLHYRGTVTLKEICNQYNIYQKAKNGCNINSISHTKLGPIMDKIIEFYIVKDQQNIIKYKENTIMTYRGICLDYELVEQALEDVKHEINNGHNNNCDDGYDNVNAKVFDDNFTILDCE